MQSLQTAPTATGWLPNRLAFGLLSALLALLLGAAWLGAERVAASRELEEARRDVRERLNGVHDRLTNNLLRDLLGAQALVSLIHLDPELSQAEFERAARPILAASPQIRNIAAAPDMVVRLMAPLQGNEAAIGLDYRKTPKQFVAADWARITRETVVAGPLELVQGGTAVIARLPVYLPTPDGKGEFWGLISAVIDVDRLYSQSGLVDPALPIEIAIRGRNASGPAGEVFFGVGGVFADSPVLLDVELPQGSWLMAARPRAGWPTAAANVWTIRLGFLVVAAMVFGALMMLLRGMHATSLAHARSRAAQRQVSALIEAAPDGIIIVDAAGTMVLLNAQAERLFGWTRDELLGRPIEMLLPYRNRPAHQELQRVYFERAALRSMRPAMDLKALRKDGSEFPVEISLGPLETEDGMVVCSVIRDISERREAEARVQRSERRASAIADNVPALIAQIDAQQCFEFANATYQDWYGIDPETMIGRSVLDVFQGPRFQNHRDHVAQVFASGERATFEVLDQHRHVSTTYVPELDARGAVCGLFVLAMDISELKAVEARLQTLARFDHLTELPNRRSFEEELLKALARSQRSGAAMGLMFIDIDHFKTINDSRGHAAGDAVLQTFAERLRQAVRVTDLVARLGGDEFVVILEPLIDEMASTTIARKIAAKMAPPIELAPGDDVQVTASIGVGIMAGQGTAADAEKLLALADDALYAAKEAGRNTFVIRTLAPTTN